jgi:hypothetical protein
MTGPALIHLRLTARDGRTSRRPRGRIRRIAKPRCRWHTHSRWIEPFCEGRAFNSVFRQFQDRIDFQEFDFQEFDFQEFDFQEFSMTAR